MIGLRKRGKKAAPAKAASPAGKKAASAAATAIDFLPDADEIERRPLPKAARITLHLLVAALISFLVWASISEVDLVVSARGRLATTLPNIVVQPLETSIVQSIEARPGQVVRKGDRLATLDPTFSQADESQLRNRLESLNTQLAAISAELQGTRVNREDQPTPDRQIQSQLAEQRRASYAAQMRRQNESIARLRTALETARQDEEALAARVKVLREMETMTDDLVSKKLAVRSRLLEVRDRLLEANRSMELARNRQAELRRELAGVEAERASFENTWRQRLLEEQLTISRERDSLTDQLQKATRRRSMVELVAPADAVVLEVAKLSKGSIVKEAETFFTLVPLGDVLEAEIQIESQDMGYVKQGAKAHVKIDAFPFQKHGLIDGKLRSISQDAFRREAGGGLEAFYVGRISLSRMKLDRMPEQAMLLPGMTLKAELNVGKRTVISYLLWPLLKASAESIREP